MMKHVFLYSGGLGSWAVAHHTIPNLPPEDQKFLLFFDTLTEDVDLYRFLRETAPRIPAELITLREGRTIWEVFRDERFLGNTRVDPCSRILKREPARAWLEENCIPEDTTIYLGLDWTEVHRFDRAIKRWEPWKITAPLCDPPYLTREDHLLELAKIGIQPPRLYKLGFAHNNCGGGCIKAGQGQYALLLRTFPARYAEWEAEEEKLRELLGDVSILRDRTGSGNRPLSLREFREHLEARECTLDLLEWGGCNCFLGEE